MTLLPFGNLPVHTPRQLVPASIDLGDWNAIAPLFDAVEKKLSSASSAAELERALLNWSELSAALDEESAKRYIAMTCHTDNADAEKSYLQFVEQVEPQTKPRQFKLEQLYLASPHRAQLPPQRYEVFDRDTKQHVELFRPENVALETDEAKLGQQYQKISGALTVQFRGEEKTLIQMGKFLEEPDRALREETWRLVVKRRLGEREKFEDIFDQLVTLRGRIAKNAGYDNYRDYAFKLRGRFDYTPEDCFAFHDAIEKEVVPLQRELQAARREQLKLPELRPWDLSVDPLNRPALKPFQEVPQMILRTQRIFDQIDPGLAQGFLTMRQQHLLDLDNRKGKAPGGYQSTLPESRLPFIFMNAVGQQRDVETMLHEAGHAFHALATRDESLYAYRGSPIEFAEVASMSMELLGAEFLGEFYAQPEEANRARRTHLEGIVATFPWVATVDAFQHWIYTHPGHTRAERSAAWLQLMDRFGGEVDWSGHKDARANLWHKQLHIFLYPFYYVEYAIAQLGALQVWANSKRDKTVALAQYQRGLALGNSRPLPELFAAAGCQFSFNRAAVQPLVRLVKSELAKLN